MKIAIISDIHSNLEALNKTFEIIDKRNIDQVVCLGDIIGYGANPNECLSLIRNRTKHILLGNHEDAIINQDHIIHFTPNAKAATLWTSNKLTEENRGFINSLPLSLKMEELLFVHSSPFELSEWHYIISGTDRELNFKYFSEPICFFGHTHTPGVYGENGDDCELERQKKFLINVGSVGQPRDHDPRLSFGIFDTELWRYENIRSEYDVETASGKILATGLPSQLAERLLIGR
jgi:predicted phosphodiesterase